MVVHHLESQDHRQLPVWPADAGHRAAPALWWAEVRLERWEPRFEMRGRRLVPAAEAFDGIWIPDGYSPMYRRIFTEAGLPVGVQASAG